MRGATRHRKKRGKQPKPFWKFVPDQDGEGGRWWHPAKLAKAGLLVGAALVLPPVVRALLDHFVDWDQLVDGTLGLFGALWKSE